MRLARLALAAVPIALAAGPDLALATDGGPPRQAVATSADGGSARAVATGGSVATRGSVAAPRAVTTPVAAPRAVTTPGAVATGRPDGGPAPAVAPPRPPRRPKRSSPETVSPRGQARPPIGAAALSPEQAKRAVEALDKVHEQETKALRRIERVEGYLKSGNVAAALQELARARRAAGKAAAATEAFATEEILTAADYVVRTAITLGIVILALVLVWALSLLLRVLLSRGAGPGEPRRPAGALLWAYRGLILVLASGLLLIAAYVSVRHVWKLRVSKERLLEVLEHPLFAFEGRPVTVLSILFFILTLAAVVIVSRRLRVLLERRVLPRFSADLGVQHAFSAILYYLLLFLGLLISLEVLGVGASTIAIVAGVLGLGVGFGMQHIINNFLSGFVIFFERPIKVGDIVDVGGTEGRVERIQARATTLLTRDNVTIIVPNSDFIQNKVTNLSYPDGVLRCRLKVGVAYGTDLPLASRLLVEIASAHQDVLRTPPPSVQLADFADSALTLELILWTKQILYRSRMFSDLRFAIDRAFREHGIVISFPQRDLHLYPTPGLRDLVVDLRSPGDGR